jgi:hypothetical protein
MSPDSSTCSIPVAGCCRILTPPRFRRPTIAEFQQLDIKRACNDEKFNFEKRRFSKVKEAFTGKLKMIFVYHYFRPYQTP